MGLLWFTVYFNRQCEMLGFNMTEPLVLQKKEREWTMERPFHPRKKLRPSRYSLNPGPSKNSNHPEEKNLIARLEEEGTPYLEEESLIETLERHNYHNDDKIAKAIYQAKKSHGSQEREIGGSYLTQHIFPVTNNSIEYWAEKNGNMPLPSYVPITALLHDCAEDDPDVCLKDIEEMFEGEFGKIVKYSLEGLTKPNWRGVPGENELEKREYVERYMIEELENVEKYLKDHGTSEYLHVIKAFDRINNLQCLPVPDMDKTRRICKNTKIIFEPWLEEKDPELAGLLYGKRQNVERILEEICSEAPLYLAKT